MTAAPDSMPAPALQARALLEQAAELLADVEGDYDYPDFLLRALADRMDYPDAHLFEGAYCMVNRETLEGFVAVNAAMRDVAGLTMSLATVFGGDGDAREAMQIAYYIDAIQQHLIAGAREHAAAAS